MLKAVRILVLLVVLIVNAHAQRFRDQLFNLGRQRLIMFNNNVRSRTITAGNGDLNFSFNYFGTTVNRFIVSTFVIKFFEIANIMTDLKPKHYSPWMYKA